MIRAAPLADDEDDFEPIELPQSRAPTPPAPCESPEPCPLAASCAARRFACKAFAEYVERGRWSTPPGKPTPELYRRVFSTAEEPDPVTVLRRRRATARKLRLSYGRTLAEQLAARKAERVAEGLTRPKAAP